MNKLPCENYVILAETALKLIINGNIGNQEIMYLANKMGNTTGVKTLIDGNMREEALYTLGKYMIDAITSDPRLY